MRRFSDLDFTQAQHEDHNLPRQSSQLSRDYPAQQYPRTRAFQSGFTQLSRDRQPSVHQPQPPLNLPQPFTRLTRDYQTSLRGPQPLVNYSAPQYPQCRASTSSFQRSAFTDPQDIRMAARQINFNNLSHSELQAQEAWAQSALLLLGPCPEGYDWLRCDHGYRCSGGQHYVTHEIIAAGRCAWYEKLKPVEIFDIRGWKDRDFELIPDHGYWWIGIQERYTPDSISLNGFNRVNPLGVAAGNVRGEFGGWEYVQPGPGAAAPTSKQLGRSSGKSKSSKKRPDDYVASGVSFPKGTVCKPGKDLRAQYERDRAWNPTVEVKPARSSRLNRRRLLGNT